MPINSDATVLEPIKEILNLSLPSITKCGYDCKLHVRRCITSIWRIIGNAQTNHVIYLFNYTVVTIATYFN